jgi:DNA-binding transcriptional MerR regulator
MEIFELAEMAEVLGMPLTKARNWTIGRPLSIPASIRTATGTGSRNLYSIEDVYLMGLAHEFSKAGFAAKAIGRLLEAVDAKRLAEMDWLTVWRAGTLKFLLREGRVQPPEGVLLWHTVNVGGLVKGIDKAVERMRKA